MRKLGLLFYMTSFSFLIRAQSFTVYNYSVPEGLPSPEVYSVYQDSKGFIWFATDNGIAKFDGKEMETFQVADGLTDPVVFEFYEDKKGRLWLRTSTGKLSYYENGKLHPYAFGDKLEKLTRQKYVNSIYYDSLDQLWVSLSTGLGKIDSNGNATSVALNGSQIFYKTIEDGSLCGVFTNSIDNLKTLTINEKSFSISSPFQNSPLVCSALWKGKLYIAYERNVFEFDGKSVKKVLTYASQIISLSADREGHLWVGALHQGVQRYKHNDFRNPWLPEFLREKSVTKVLQDHENGLWATTLEKGVFYIPNFLIENYNFSSSSKIRDVLAANSNIIIGDEQGTVTALNKKNRKLVWKKLFDGPVLGLHNCKKDLWILVGGRGIMIYDSAFVCKKENITAGHLLSDLSSDTILNIGPAAFRKFDRHGKEIFGKPTLSVYQNLLIDDPYIFLGKRAGGLHILDRNLELIGEPEEFSNFKITSILELDDSHLIIGTRGNGFLLVNKKDLHYRMFNFKSMFAANNIYSVVKIDSSLWLGTEKGIAKVSIKALLANKPTFRFLTRRSGLVSDKINFLLYSDPDVWAFYDEGFSVLTKNTEVFPNRNPLFYIKNLKVNNQPVDLKEGATLSHNKNNISIDLGFIAFNNQSIFIRHKLKKENPWNYSSNRNLEFYALAPGSYKLELEYSLDNNNWIPANPLPVFTITPPWWLRWYFQLGSILVLAFLCYLYFRNQLRIAQQHQLKLIQSEIETLERERNRIAKDLHDGVGTNLSAIKLMVNQLLRNHNEPMTEDVEEKFQSTIKEIKDIIYGLTPPGLERYGLFTGLKNYILKLNKSIPVEIHFKAFGQEVHKPELGLLVFRIIQELLSNSIKHSFAKNITIHINSFDTLLNIVFEDDGIGFSYDPEKSGLGLSNVESRIESVNGNLKFESGKFGTSYLIDIPLK